MLLGDGRASAPASSRATTLPPGPKGRGRFLFGQEPWEGKGLGGGDGGPKKKKRLVVAPPPLPDSVMAVRALPLPSSFLPGARRQNPEALRGKGRLAEPLPRAPNRRAVLGFGHPKSKSRAEAATEPL